MVVVGITGAVAVRNVAAHARVIIAKLSETRDAGGAALSDFCLVCETPAMFRNAAVGVSVRRGAQNLNLPLHAS
jgi:hypothetical protein